MSIRLGIARTLVGMASDPLKSDETLRRFVAQDRVPAPPSRRIRRLCSVDSRSVEGRDVITLRPHHLPMDAPHVLYFHGGAYVSEMEGGHWTILASLLERVPAMITIPQYGLAPQHDVDDAFAFLEVVATNLVADEQRGRVIYAGDSAGGGLALAFAVHQRDTFAAAAAEVAALILFSPWADVSMTNPQIADFAGRDPMQFAPTLGICGTWWAGARSSTDPAVSPLYADLSGLAPVHLFQGDRDLFYPDTVRLDRSIGDAGGQSSLTIARGGFHVYVAPPWTPEARYALDRAAGVIAG